MTTNEVRKNDTSAELSADDKLKLASNGEIANDPNEGQIVHRQQYVDSSGKVGEKVHGPMPVGEWSKYSRDNNL